MQRGSKRESVCVCVWGGGGGGQQKQMDRHANTHVYRLKREERYYRLKREERYLEDTHGSKRQTVLHELQLQKLMLNIYKYHP